METGHLSTTRAVNSGSGNRALAVSLLLMTVCDVYKELVNINKQKSIKSKKQRTAKYVMYIC